MTAANATRWATGVMDLEMSRYRELLRRDAPWDAADEAAFLEAGRALGKSVQEMAADRHVVSVIRQHQRVVAEWESVLPEYENARDARNRYREETQQILNKREAGFRERERAVVALLGKYEGARAARRALFELMPAHRDLLGPKGADRDLPVLKLTTAEAELVS